jgi:hypothetical protein
MTLNLTAQYGTLQIFIIALKKRLRLGFYHIFPAVIYSELLELANPEVKQFLIKLSTCIVDDKFPIYDKQTFQEYYFHFDDEEMNQIIGGETIRDKYLRFYYLLDND